MSGEKRYSGGFSGAVSRAPATADGERGPLPLWSDAPPGQQYSASPPRREPHFDECARPGDWVEALDGTRLETRLDPMAVQAGDAGPAGVGPAMVGIGWMRPRPMESSTNYYNSALAAAESADPTPPSSNGPEQRLPAAYLRQLKAQNDAAAAAATGGGGGHPQQRPGMVSAGGADRRQAASLSPQQLEQLARQPPGSQRLPRKWGKARKGDDSDDSGSADDELTYMPSENLAHLPGGGWGHPQARAPANAKRQPGRKS